MSDALGHYDDHPAYRNQALLVGSNIKFGRDRTQVPNWEVEIARNIMPWFGDTLLAAGDDRGVNMVAVLFDVFTDEVTGVAFAETNLDETTWSTTKTALAAFPLSVLQTEQTEFRSFVAQLLEYGDLWLRRTGSKLELGYWKQGLSQAEVDAIATIGSDDLTSEPRLKSDGYDDCYTEVNVIFKDREQYYHDAVATYRNPGLLRQLGEPRSITIQRPWITDATLAQQYATYWGQKFGRPRIAGDADVKVEIVESLNLAPGALCKLESAALGYEIVFRIIAVEYPADDEAFCTLELENERSIWPSIFVQPPPGRIGDFIVGVPNIAYKRVFELPAAFTGARDLEVAILAQRPGSSVLGFNVYTSLGGVTYDEHTQPCTFAAYGLVVNANYSGATADTDTVTGMQVLFYGVDLPVSQSDTQRDDLNLLCFVDNEIMSVGQIVALGSGVYRVYFKRALYGTLKAAHNIGAAVYIIARKEIVPVENKNFVVGNTVYFKLQPFDARQEFDLAEVTAFTYTFTGAPVPPTPTGLNVTGAVETLLIEWDKVADPALVLYTEIRFSFTPTYGSSAVIAEVPYPGTSYLWDRTAAGVGRYVSHFIWLRHVNAKGLPSAAAGPDSAIPVVPSAVQCATPVIVQADVAGAGARGDDDYRLAIVDTQGGADIYFSYDGNNYVTYSATGNYRSPTSGAVLPTDNGGAISLAESDKLYAYAVKATFLQSATAMFWNNTSNTPAGDGGGGTGGGGGKNLP